MKFKLLATAACVTTALMASGTAQAQEKLTVWWGKGFYKAEDDALFAAIKKFEAKNPKIKIDLSLYAPQEMIPKSVQRWTLAILLTLPMVTCMTFKLPPNGPTTGSSKM